MESIHIQKVAFEKNGRLLYPQNGIDYKKMEFKSGEQLSNIKQWLNKFHNYRGMRIKSKAIFDNLSFGRAANHFEEALREIGEMLGFKSQRPDNDYKVGPDNLWCGVHNQYLFVPCTKVLGNYGKFMDYYHNFMTPEQLEIIDRI